MFNRRSPTSGQLNATPRSRTGQRTINKTPPGLKKILRFYLYHNFGKCGLIFILFNFYIYKGLWRKLKLKLTPWSLKSVADLS